MPPSDETLYRVPIVAQWMIDKDKAEGMSEALAAQEYDCSFEGAMESAFYGAAMMKAEEEDRICDLPWDERYPVVTAWDLGIFDYTAIWFVQEVNGFHHWIDYLEGRDLPFTHYLGAVLQKSYAYTDHIGPHDIGHREKGSGQSLHLMARDFGIFFRVAPKMLVKDGIAALRAILPKSRFDKGRCERGIEGLKRYRRLYDKEHDEYLDQPVHDWASHPADSARTYAVARRAVTTWTSTPTPRRRMGTMA